MARSSKFDWFRLSPSDKPYTTTIPREKFLKDIEDKGLKGKPEEVPPADPVNHPPHYQVGGIEVLDYIKAKLTPSQYEGYLLGNVHKYTARFSHKDGIRDLRKARFYLDKLIDHADIHQPNP